MNSSARTFELVAVRFLLLIAIGCVLPSSMAAQIQQARFPVRLDILIQPTPQHAVMTRRWSPVFQKLNQSISFRGGKQGERVRMEETDTAGRKGVYVVGILNSDGTIRVPGKTFSALQPVEISEWLTRLKRFGALGPADESPTWGLSEAELTSVLRDLSAEVIAPIDFRSATFAVESLKLPERFTIEFTDEARPLAGQPALQVASEHPDCTGLSKGSALAVALAQFGLGFRPKRTTPGGYILEIDRGDETDNLYPVGWKNRAPISLVVRPLAKRFDVDLENAPLPDIIRLIAQKLEVPFAYASSDLVQAGILADRLTYSRKPDKLTPERLMRSIEAKTSVAFSLRTDEAGKVFLWVTTKNNKDAFVKRFAHIKPVIGGK